MYGVPLDRSPREAQSALLRFQALMREGTPERALEPLERLDRPEQEPVPSSVFDSPLGAGSGLLAAKESCHQTRLRPFTGKRDQSK